MKVNYLRLALLAVVPLVPLACEAFPFKTLALAVLAVSFMVDERAKGFLAGAFLVAVRVLPRLAPPVMVLEAFTVSFTVEARRRGFLAEAERFTIYYYNRDYHFLGIMSIFGEKFHLVLSYIAIGYTIWN